MGNFESNFNPVARNEKKNLNFSLEFKIYGWEGGGGGDTKA